MTSNLKLDRPLVIFDIEATGTSARLDRIVELCLVRLLPDGTREVHTYRINPEMKIPEEAAAIHGITDDDVKDCPTFDQVAKNVLAIIADADLGGYNAVNFDIPMLVEEFLRAKIKFDVTGHRIVDAQRIFHKKEPRDLTAAVKFFCNEALDNAHGAEADALATVKVLEAELERYKDLPHDVASLDEFCNPRDPSWADRSGKLKWVNGELVINFGKKQGTSVAVLSRMEPSFLKWILKGDFPRDTQDIVKNALDGKLPDPPAKA